jgi:hypothetical protein
MYAVEITHTLRGRERERDEKYREYERLNQFMLVKNNPYGGGYASELAPLSEAENWKVVKSGNVYTIYSPRKTYRIAGEDAGACVGVDLKETIQISPDTYVSFRKDGTFELFQYGIGVAYLERWAGRWHPVT